MYRNPLHERVSVHLGAPRTLAGGMTLTYQEAAARVTGPGERFETTDAEIRGVTYTIFKNAPRSLRDVFAPARQRGDDIFLVYEDERWSFDEVMRHVDALGSLLVNSYGVQNGDRVAIGMRNYPEWFIAFAAITSIGAVSVSLNAWWTEDELDYALEDSGSKVLIADVERVERSRSSAARLSVATIGVRLPSPIVGVDRWEDAVDTDGARMPEVDVEPDDDATILYT